MGGVAQKSVILLNAFLYYLQPCFLTNFRKLFSSFFIIYQDRQELETKVKEEQEQIQTLRQSLTDLEEQLKNTGDDNLSQLQKLSLEIKNLKKKLVDHEINLKGEKSKIEQLEQEVADQKSHAQKIGLKLSNCQKQIFSQEKQNKVLSYCLIGAIAIILLGIFYFVYRKFFKVG